MLKIILKPDFKAIESDSDDIPPPQPPKFKHYGVFVKKRYSDQKTGKRRLFAHQIEALDALEKWFTNVETQDKTAVVVMRTSSGKTDVIFCLPYTLGAVAERVHGLDL